MMMMMMMMMVMMNYFWGMVDRRKTHSFISSRDHCQRSLLSRIFDTPRTGFEPAQNLNSSFNKRSCAVVVTTTSRCHNPQLGLISHVWKVTFWVVVAISNPAICLTLSWRRPLSYRNQSTDLLCKSMEWFLYDNGLRHERVKLQVLMSYLIEGSFFNTLKLPRVSFWLLFLQILFS